KMSWMRNASGLDASAKRRAETTRRRADEPIATLLRDLSRRINFNTVAMVDGVAKAYLYKEPALRQRIDLLRQQQIARRQLAPARDRTEASTRLLIAAKDRRIREQNARVKQLEVELASCRGRLYASL